MKTEQAVSNFLRILALVAVPFGVIIQSANAQNHLSDYIRPLVGTSGREGNTYPGPSAPFGMIQLSPDTDNCVTNWSTCSGYSYDDPTILGFNLTHLSGTGCPAASGQAGLCSGGGESSGDGNDDCGQMSAWYIFTCLGFYPVCPGNDYYVIGAPQIPGAVVHLSNGKTFTMTADHLSDQNIYVQSVKLNGKIWNSPFLPYKDLKRGGSMEFTMGPKPSQWGTNPVMPQ